MKTTEKVFGEVSTLLESSSSDSDISKQLGERKRDLEVLRQKTYALANAIKKDHEKGARWMPDDAYYFIFNVEKYSVCDVDPTRNW